MRKRISTEVLRHWAPVAVCLLMILVLLAVPTAATVYRLLKQDVAHRRSAGQEVP